MSSVDRLLKRLTLEQKIAQIQGIAPYDLIGEIPTELPDDFDLDLSTGIPYDFTRIPVVRPNGVGHLSVARTLDPDPDRLRALIDEFRRYAAEVNPLGIGTLTHGEAINGLAHDRADQFPTAWGQASAPHGRRASPTGAHDGATEKRRLGTAAGSRTW